ncbi:tetratricopeptide repeat protein [Caldichromatium japonicum]|uniref:tetratricopeptide repeat protein n=1 Tax=Caldichromatium japonicum TaxID=2699430 RepID=UPI001FE4F2E5|nr:tetratricopeptide repeat protein [Caldichromatium japonicum]
MLQRPFDILALSLAAALGLSACALGSREGPPAPVVRVTPRPEQPARSSQRAAQPTPPAQPPASLPKPATQVFAYRDPSLSSETPPALHSAPQAPSQPLQPPTAATPVVPSQPPPIQPKQLGDQTAVPSAGPGVVPVQPLAPSQPSAPETAGAQPVPAMPSPDQPAAEPQTAKPPQVAKVGPRPVMPVSEQPSAPTRPAASLPPANIAAPELPPAAAKLAAQSEQHRRAGDYAAAAAALERSLRIAPRDPYLLNRLARVRLEQGQAELAANLAARANDLAGGREDLKRDNWHIIAASKRQTGDEEGARQAEQRAGF